MNNNVQTPRLSDAEKGMIIGYHLSGYTVREISQILRRTKATVYQWVNRFRNEGIAGLNVRNRSGRPRETDLACDQRIVAAAILSPFDTAEEIKETAEAFNISIRSVRSRLLEAGLHARKPSVKNFLKETHRANRIKFAREHIHYNLDFWRKVIWSDEKTFVSSGRPPQYVRRMDGTRNDSANLARNLWSTRTSVNVWGCVTYDGPGVLHRIDGKLESKQYLDILKTKMRPFAVQNFPLPVVADGVNEFRFFQHDGCPSHNARIVKDWLGGEALEEHRIKTLWWPAYSPDLNPIENFWGFMVRNMGQMEVNNAEDVYDWVFQFWETMENNQAYWQSLIESMPTRLARVLELNGDMTEY